jgi:hypothetical protein
MCFRFWSDGILMGAWFCIASVPVILYCAGCWMIWCTMDTGMHKEALTAEFAVVLALQ